jgi:hypothetical protein
LSAWQGFRLFRVAYTVAAYEYDGSLLMTATRTLMSLYPDAGDCWWHIVVPNGSVNLVRILNPETVTEVWIEAPDMDGRKPDWQIPYCTRGENGVWMPPQGVVMRYTCEEVDGGRRE